ncbi:MAG: 4-hydroxy-3-methylbut-2-enyl diphosphate reductase [Deltaproteobacteria bacterium]|nr:4-hydroxy-3-methylbut-2-enyl diphosphate reductase [Deltaproteobacteria bacterium]
MKVKLAKTAGFCMGVRRAMEIVMAEANKAEGPLFTFGPLIHNHQVLDLLKSKGVRVIDTVEGIEEGKIIIRAHGIPPQKRQMIENSGLQVIDATCPKVTRVQAIIRHFTRKGHAAVIVGDQDHAEVIGLMGYSEMPAHVIQQEADVSALPELQQPFVVAQTTQNEKNFRAVVKALERRFPDLEVFDTICDATHERQQEVRTFKGQMDGVVVVGGYHSGNTRRLVQISRGGGMPTFHVETEKDLDKKALSQMNTIGLTAGASTPHWMIKTVVSEIEQIRGWRETGLIRRARQALRFLVLSNLIAAAGAFSLAYGASVLAGKGHTLIFPILAFFYIYAMHVFNRFLDKGASVYNDPDRAAFLNHYRKLLVITGLTGIVVALGLAYTVGMVTFLILLGLSALGVIYSIPVVPKAMKGKARYSRIKDIPGSRSLSEALAWTAVIVVLPTLENGDITWHAALATGSMVFSLSYVRAILFSLFQVEGDLMVGTETLPISLGKERTMQLLKIVLFITALILGLSPLLNITAPATCFLLFPLFTLSVCLLAYEKGRLHPGLMLESLVESNFLMTGIVVAVGQSLLH